MNKYGISAIVGIALIILGVILSITQNAGFGVICAGIGLIVIINYFAVKAAANKRTGAATPSEVSQTEAGRQVTHRSLDAVIAVIIFVLLLIGVIALLFKYLGI